MAQDAIRGRRSSLQISIAYRRIQICQVLLNHYMFHRKIFTLDKINIVNCQVWKNLHTRFIIH
jgi:hypothetical protein